MLLAKITLEERYTFSLHWKLCMSIFSKCLHKPLATAFTQIRDQSVVPDSSGTSKVVLIKKILMMNQQTLE